MPKNQLNSLLDGKSELKELNNLLKTTREQVDSAVEQGNDALLTLQDEFDKLAEKKRNLLRDIEKLEDDYNRLKDKMGVAENTYGKYLDAIRSGRKKDV